MTLACSRRAFLGGVAASLVRLDAHAQTPAGPRILEARPGKARLTPAADAAIWGFDGTTPGPLLRYKQGDDLDVRLVNRLDQPLSIHWHGLRGDNGMDGVAPLTQAAVAPGGQFDYRRKLVDPGLFCYRPSVFPQSGELIGRGLKGLLLVDEPAPLPGDADLLLVLDDWKLDEKGEIAGDFHNDAEARGAGRIGKLVAVNGRAAPASYEFAPGARLRLRLANLANARLMPVSVEGAQPFVVAIDSQPCDAFEPVRRTIPVAPGARFEVFFDLPAKEGEKTRLSLRGADGQDQDLVVVTTKGARAQERGPIKSLPNNPALPAVIRLDASKKVDLIIERKEAPGPAWLLNSAVSRAYAGDPLFRVKRGTPVTLGFNNRTEIPLVMHVHGHAVRLLHDLDDGWEPYWRNGVVVPPKKVKHVAFLADSPGKWALHDDILEHEAAGLATWFEVT